MLIEADFVHGLWKIFDRKNSQVLVIQISMKNIYIYISFKRIYFLVLHIHAAKKIVLSAYESVIERKKRVTCIKRKQKP